MAKEHHRILVCGDRHWTDMQMVWAVLDGLWVDHSIGWEVSHLQPFVLIEGGAAGADEHAGTWARSAPTHSHNERPQDPPFEHLHFPADWDRYGRRAGPIRNVQMLNEGRPDLVVAFHDDIDNSKGTAHMVDIATKAGVDVWHLQHRKAHR